MIKRITALLLIVLFLTFCGCEKNWESAGEGCVTFTDALGREVSVSRSPERVAALIGSFADVWMLSGGRICAAAEDA